MTLMNYQEDRIRKTARLLLNEGNSVDITIKTEEDPIIINDTKIICDLECKHERFYTNDEENPGFKIEWINGSPWIGRGWMTIDWGILDKISKEYIKSAKIKVKKLWEYDGCFAKESSNSTFYIENLFFPDIRRVFICEDDKNKVEVEFVALSEPKNYLNIKKINLEEGQEVKVELFDGTSRIIEVDDQLDDCITYYIGDKPYLIYADQIKNITTLDGTPISKDDVIREDGNSTGLTQEQSIEMKELFK